MTPFSSASIVDFEHVNVSWDINEKTDFFKRPVVLLNLFKIKLITKLEEVIYNLRILLALRQIGVLANRSKRQPFLQKWQIEAVARPPKLPPLLYVMKMKQWKLSMKEIITDITFFIIWLMYNLQTKKLFQRNLRGHVNGLMVSFWLHIMSKSWKNRIY